MKLTEIMNRAAQACPDEYILRFWDEQRQCAVPCEGAGIHLRVSSRGSCMRRTTPR